MSTINLRGELYSAGLYINGLYTYTIASDNIDTDRRILIYKQDRHIEIPESSRHVLISKQDRRILA